MTLLTSRIFNLNQTKEFYEDLVDKEKVKIKTDSFELKNNTYFYSLDYKNGILELKIYFKKAKKPFIEINIKTLNTKIKIAEILNFLRIQTI